MSISLRDQMVQIGLATAEQAEAAVTAKKKVPPQKGKPKPKKKNPARAKKAPQKPDAKVVSEREQEEAIQLAKRKEVKAQIKALIEDNCEKEISGEVVYSYQVGDRIRQIYTTEGCRDKLAKGELAITRLNRQTYLIPPLIGDQVLGLNSEWLVIYHDPNQDQTQPDMSAEDPYKDFPVPDDLNW